MGDQLETSSRRLVAWVVAWACLLAGCMPSDDSFTLTSDAKAITSFSFVKPSATGKIDELAKTISVTVPYGSTSGHLVASFATTGTRVMVGSTEQVSASTSNDFSKPVSFVVTAENGSAVSYTVKVNESVTELYVLNTGGGFISVFNAGASGDVEPLRRFGSMTGLNAPVGVAVDQVHDEIFVANSGNRSITAYCLNDQGNTAPVRIISGSATQLFSTGGIAVDATGDLIFVVAGGYIDASIAVFSRTASGNAAPLRRIIGASTRLLYPEGIAVDSANGELFVTDSGRVLVFGIDDSGNTTPRRVIEGPDTGLGYNHGIAIDSARSEMIVSGQSNSIKFYDLKASGNVRPLRSIQGINTGLKGPYGVAMSSDGGEIVVANYGAITVYRTGDVGDAMPLRKINASNTDLPGASALAIDAASKRVFVTSPLKNSIDAFDETAAGDATPVRSISAASTGLNNPQDLAVDVINDEVFVVNGDDSITVYDRRSAGSVSPLRTIAASNRNILGQRFIAIDALRGEVLVSSGDLVSIFGTRDSGGVGPLRTISGSATGLYRPGGMAVDSSSGLIFVSDGTEGWRYPVNGPYTPTTIMIHTVSDVIRVYPIGSSGNVAPAATVSSERVRDSYETGPLVADFTNNELYAPYMDFSYTGELLGQTFRIITNCCESASNRVLQIDPVNNDIYGARDKDFIVVHRRGAGIPYRGLWGPNTRLEGPLRIALW